MQGKYYLSTSNLLRGKLLLKKISLIFFSLDNSKIPVRSKDFLGGVFLSKARHKLRNTNDSRTFRAFQFVIAVFERHNIEHKHDMTWFKPIRVNFNKSIFYKQCNIVSIISNSNLPSNSNHIMSNILINFCSKSVFFSIISINNPNMNIHGWYGTNCLN